MSKLSAKYRITDRNLELRKQFLRLDDRDRRILAQLASWADRKADAIAREFYDHQFSFPPTVAYFEGQARRRGTSMANLRSHLEKSQAGYLRQIFQEAATGGNFGAAYFEKRLHVGQLHNFISLPVKWYLGAYQTYFDLVRKHLKASFPMRPRFREKAERAILVVFNYDTQAVIDAFFYDYLESIGLDLERIAVSHADHDLSEYYGEMKGVVRETLSETVETTQVLEESMTQMVSDLGEVKQATEAIASASDRVGGSTQTLAASVEETSSSIAQMAASIAQVAGNSETLSAAVSQTSASIEEMAASVQQVARNVEEASHFSASSATVAQVGQTSVEQTISGMQQITQAMSQVVTVIQNLGKSSEEIGNIISVIDDIAEQTNLLALNAAIEAARAGEHGRGFAVVADEVRKLAERSAKATGEIAELITGIQKETEQAVKSTQVGEKAIADGTGLAQKAGESLSAIVTAVDHVSGVMSQIRQATQEQSRAAAQITAAVTAMNQLTRSVQGATQEQTTGSEQIVRAVETLSRITRELTQATNEQRQAGTRAVEAIVRISALSGEVDRKTSSLARAVSYFKLSKTEKQLTVPAANPPARR